MMVVKKIDSVELARMRNLWDRSDTSTAHDPAEALIMALDAISSGSIKPEHIFVAIATEGKDAGGIGFRHFCAGPFSLRETIGLLDEAKVTLWEDSKR